MKMRKNIELIAILMAVLAACLFTACDGGAMEELWKDELENGNVPVSERIVTDEGAVIISKTFEIQRNAEQEVTIAASPASVTEGAENITTIKFPAGSFGSSGETVTETINVVVYPTPVAAAKFTVSSESAVAGLDLTVTVNDVPVTTFNNQVVKVTTYIAKNLTNVGIHYENENWTQVAQETDVDATHEFFYDSTTGKLIFGTTHFSQFLLSANEVAYVESNQTAYLDLSDAITSATDGDTVVLLKNISQNEMISLKKSLTIGGSGHKITSTANTPTFSIDTSGTDLTLNNLIVTGTGDGNQSSAVRIAAQNVKLSINSCDLSKNMYLIDVKNYGNPGYDASKSSVIFKPNNPFVANGDKTALEEDATCSLTIKDSKLSGYGCINWKYVGGTCLIENCELSDGADSNWASIIIEGNGASITVKNSEFKLHEDLNSAIFQCGAKDCILEFVNCTGSGNGVTTLAEMRAFVVGYNGGEFEDGEYYYSEKAGGVIMDNSGDFWSISTGNKFICDGVEILAPTISE